MKLRSLILGICFLSSCKLGSSGANILADDGSGSGNNCSYADAAAHDGWGYDPQAGNGKNCPPRDGSGGPQISSTCDYKDADKYNGWGYDPQAGSGKNCPPRNQAVPVEGNKFSTSFCTHGHDGEPNANLTTHDKQSNWKDEVDHYTESTVTVGLSGAFAGVEAGVTHDTNFQIHKTMRVEALFNWHAPNDDFKSYQLPPVFINADSTQPFNLHADPRDVTIIRCTATFSFSLSNDVTYGVKALVAGTEIKKGKWEEIGTGAEWLMRAEDGDTWAKAVEKCNSDFEANGKQTKELEIKNAIKQGYGWVNAAEVSNNCVPSSESDICFN